MFPGPFQYLPGPVEYLPGTPADFPRTSVPLAKGLSRMNDLRSNLAANAVNDARNRLVSAACEAGLTTGEELSRMNHDGAIAHIRAALTVHENAYNLQGAVDENALQATRKALNLFDQLAAKSLAEKMNRVQRSPNAATEAKPAAANTVEILSRIVRDRMADVCRIANECRLFIGTPPRPARPSRDDVAFGKRSTPSKLSREIRSRIGSILKRMNNCESPSPNLTRLAMPATRRPTSNASNDSRNAPK